MCSPTKKHLLDIFGAGPDLESAEVDYTEVEVSTLDPHRGNKLSSLYGLCLGATLGLLVLPDIGLVLAPGNARVVLCVCDSLLPVVLLNLAGAVGSCAAVLAVLLPLGSSHSHLHEVCVEQGSQLELWL